MFRGLIFFWTHCSQDIATSLIATGTHVSYGITQYYLPPGRGDIPALILVEASLQG